MLLSHYPVRFEFALVAYAYPAYNTVTRKISEGIPVFIKVGTVSEFDDLTVLY